MNITGPKIQQELQRLNVINGIGRYRFIGYDVEEIEDIDGR